jgi:hypothetical protein
MPPWLSLLLIAIAFCPNKLKIDALVSFSVGLQLSPSCVGDHCSHCVIHRALAFKSIMFILHPPF